MQHTFDHLTLNGKKKCISSHCNTLWQGHLPITIQLTNYNFNFRNFLLHNCSENDGGIKHVCIILPLQNFVIK